VLLVETAPLRRLGAWSPADPDAPHEPELHTEPTGINSTEPAFLSDGDPLTLDRVHINSNVVFGLLELLGISYRPALADLPDQKGWRIKADDDYGPLNAFARGKIDTAKIRRNWEDILRVVASIYTGTVRAYDVVTTLQRDGRPTALGEAIAMYGRIFKTLHILSYIDVDETCRRDIKGIRNLQEGRHALARKICHGKKGELYHRYERGLEDPTRRPRPRAELRRALDHRLPRRRRPPAQGPGLPGPGRGHGPPVAVRQQPPRRPRDLQLRPA
jgi:hypothetical protein